MSDDEKSIQSMGGQARADILSPEQRREIARKGAASRWGVPKATHEGSIDLAKHKGIPCAVLEDGTRLLTQGGFLRAIGRADKAKGGQGSTVDDVIPFLAANNLKPFISNELMESTKPIRFRTDSGVMAFGYKAEILPQVCEVYLDARTAGVLHSTQVKIAHTAELIVRGLARVGIIALIDEATGFQDVRDRLALAKILEKYLLAEGYRKWERTFPLEYYRELFRLKGWTFDPTSTARPGVIGRITNNIVYDRLQPGILKKLRELNPKDDSGRRKRHHHQHFTGEIGIPELKDHLSNVTVLMRVSDNWGRFLEFLDRAKPRVGDTLRLPLEFND